MSDVTVAQFAEVLKVPVDRLLVQLESAGIQVSGPQALISDEAKLELLTHLRRAHGASEPASKSAAGVAAPRKITLARKTQSELKQASTQGRARTVNVEVRHKKTYIKRDVLEEQNKQLQDEVDHKRKEQEAAEAAERERADDDDPGAAAADRPARDQLDEVERREPEQERRPREGGQHQRVVPDRRRRALVQMDEVGQQVRRVREEEEPEDEQDPRERVEAAAGAQEGGEREDERHPGEEEVPDEEAVEGAPRLVDLHEKRGHRQSGCGGECGDQPQGRHRHDRRERGVLQDPLRLL